MRQRVLVLGTVNRDRLVLPGEGVHGTVHTSLGGICYTLLALGALHPELELDARALVGLDARKELDCLLAGRGISSGELLFRPAPTNRITLDCRSPDHKRERSELSLGGYHRDECPPGPYAGVLLNLTSGREFTLPVWREWRRRLRAASPGVHLQMDLHSLSLDYRRNRTRHLRRLPDWDAWVEDLDLLQLTLDECGSLSPHPPRSLARTGPLLERIHAQGTREVVITDGARGLLHSGPLGVTRLPALPARVRDTTGCGDVLGAALFGASLDGRPLDRKLEWARAAATRKLASCGVEGLAEWAGERSDGGGPGEIPGTLPDRS